MNLDFSDPHLSRLKEQYPETPDSIILKAAVLREGLQFTQDLAEIGRWAIPGNPFISREVPPAERAKEIKGGIYSLPYQFVLGDDTRVSIILDSNSPYVIRKKKEGGHAIYRNDKPVAEVSFSPRPGFIDRPMPNGSSFNKLISQRSEACMAAVISTHCVYAADEEQCAYCALGSKYAGRKSVDVSGAISRKSKKIDAMALAALEMDIEHVVLSGGSFDTLSSEAIAYAGMVERMRYVLGSKTKIHVCSQPLREEGWLMLKQAGTDCIQPNIEVWNEKIWPKIIPGKAKASSKNQVLDRLKRGVDIFGPGNVSSNFVAGAESLGGRNADQELTSLLEGFATLLSYGVVPIFGFLSKAENTKFANLNLHPVDFYLRLGWERWKLMKNYGMYKTYGALGEHDFSCYKCVSHKTGQDYSRLLHLAIPENE